MKQNWILITIIATGALVFIAVISLIFMWGVYNRHWEGPIVGTVVSVVPMPAGRLAGQPALVRDYMRDVRSIEKFLSSEEAKQQGVARAITMEDRKQALERLLKELALEELAFIRKIEITDEQMNEAIALEFNPEGAQEQEFEAHLMETYGWTLDDFKSHVVRPALLTRHLAASYASDHGNDLGALETYLEERVSRLDVIRYIKF
jgi:parvulin-like peptidyl-prolyl isomerase